MANAGLRVNDAGQQLELVGDSLHDERPSVATGFPGIDVLLRRGGILPGNLVLLGGRTGTRKTTVTVNLILAMAKAGVPVALAALDESPWQYVVKLMSAWSGRNQDAIESEWDSPQGSKLRDAYRSSVGQQISLLTGRRPSPEHLDTALAMGGAGKESPRVVFIDYLAQMTRDGEYRFGDNTRLPRLCEDLGIWASDSGITVIALHQLSRNDEYGNTNNRNSGHAPVTLTQLKFGGEEQADIVLSTYRPAMHPMASMTIQIAKEVMGDKFDEDYYFEIKALAKKYANSTFLQLLKNRPGIHREERGIELISPNDSLEMEEKHDAQ